MSSKLPENLLILREYGEGVLQRITYARRQVHNAPIKPILFNEEFAKLRTNLVKKFPEVDSSVEKSQGYDTLTSRAKQIGEQLEPLYHSFVDLYKFTRAAVGVLQGGNQISDFTLENNPLTTSHYMDLFSTYSRAIFAVTSFEEGKVILAAYNRCLILQRQSSDPEYSTVATFINNCGEPVKLMAEDTKGLQAALSKAVVSLTKFYTQSRLVQHLRESSTLSIILKPEDLSKPVIDKFHLQMLYNRRISQWILFGLISCPEAMASQPVVDILKSALSEGWVYTIRDGFNIGLHGVYLTLFETYKSKTANLKDKRKNLKECFQKTGESVSKHKEHRIYIRQELASLLRLFEDEPGLIAPKFLMLLNGISMATEEIFLYFRHLRNLPAPKFIKKAVTEDDFRDMKITELVWLIDQLRSIAKTHKREIQTYYVEYLRGCHTRELGTLTDHTFNQLVGPHLEAACNSIKSDISNASPDSDFKMTRLNWFRVETSLSSASSSVPLARVDKALSRFTLIITHTRFIDEFDELLEEYSSLSSLYVYKDAIQDHVTRAMRDAPTHCMSLVKMCSSFSEGVNRYNSEEYNDVGVGSVGLVEKSLDDICNRVVILINEVAKSFVGLTQQLTETNSSWRLLQQQPGYKPHKDFLPPPQPGSESEYKRRGEQDSLRQIEHNAWSLCTALNQFETITIHNTVFAPKEFLREKVQEAFRKHIRSNATVEVEVDNKHTERMIQRPSLLEASIDAYTSALKLIENYLDLDIDEMLREVMLSESYIPALKKSGNFEWVDVDDSDIKFNGSLVGSYVQWYGDFVSKKLATPGIIIYSPNRKCFMSKQGVAFKAQLYADLNEFKSLANLIGPYGIKLIEREVLKYVLQGVTGIKDYVSLNRHMLDELQKTYCNENAANDALKKMKDVEGFMSKSVAIGNALYFRELLHEALRWVSQERIPHIYSVVHASFKEYRSNTFMATEFLSIDSLAYDCGVNVGSADQALKKYLQKAISSIDGPLLDLLPYMYASSFFSLMWREAEYKPFIEAHTNNVHTLAKAINFLILSSKALSTTNADEKEITNQLKTFIEVSSVLLLRLARNTSVKDKTAPVDLPSVLIFMDLFLEESPLLTRDVLESVLPYGLLRNEWKHVFAPKELKKKAVDY